MLFFISLFSSNTHMSEIANNEYLLQSCACHQTHKLLEGLFICYVQNGVPPYFYINHFAACMAYAH